MRNKALRKHSNSAATPDPDIVQSFPFITDAGWYQEFWYEREPGWIHKLIALLFRLRPQRTNLPRKAAGVSDRQSRLHVSDVPVTLHGPIS